MPLRPLPPDFCPINDDLPEGWYCPVTILPEDYFIRRIREQRMKGFRQQQGVVRKNRTTEMNLFEE